MADTNRHVIKHISKKGTTHHSFRFFFSYFGLFTTFLGIVTTVAGGDAGFADGPGGKARFFFPHALAIAQNGNIYVADTGNSVIRRITPTLEVQTVKRGEEIVKIKRPTGITWSDEGNFLLVSDFWTHRIVQINT